MGVIMAANGREIELKFPVGVGDFQRVKELLDKTAIFSGASSQKDDYYTPPYRNFLEQEFPFEWLSIRKRGGKCTLHYKHFHPEGSEVFTHCDEVAVEIGSAQQFEQMLCALNFKKLVTVEKERKLYSLNNECEIALDIVHELGYFVEIEASKEFGTVDETRKRLFAVAQQFGLDTSKTEHRGYPYLMLKRKV